jgi:GlpG protein
MKRELTPARRQGRERPPILTIAVCVICGLVFLSAFGSTSAADLARLGVVPKERILAGAYWALLTSNFVHVDLWHVVFNVYWMWVLGGVVERHVSPLVWLAVLLVSSIVCSVVELAISDTTGYGLSGVVYAFFGLIWAARKRVREFEALARQSTLLWIWLFVCVVLTRLDILRVGNGAHFAGVAVGLGAGGLWARTRSADRPVAGATTKGTTAGGSARTGAPNSD